MLKTLYARLVLWLIRPALDRDFAGSWGIKTAVGSSSTDVST